MSACPRNYSPVRGIANHLPAAAGDLKSNDAERLKSSGENGFRNSRRREAWPCSQRSHRGVWFFAAFENPSAALPDWENDMVRLLTSMFGMLCICLLAFTPAMAEPADEVKAAYSAWDEAFNRAD